LKRFSRTTGRDERYQAVILRHQIAVRPSGS